MILKVVETGQRLRVKRCSTAHGSRFLLVDTETGEEEGPFNRFWIENQLAEKVLRRETKAERKRRSKALRRNFREGDRVRCSQSGKVFAIERIETLHGEKWLLRSCESKNPGSPKLAAFIINQINDGHLVKVRKND